MASKVSIANLALNLIGSPANVESSDPWDASEEGAKCDQFYPIARDIMLSEHAWSFATMRTQLTGVALPSYIYEWAYAYQGLPSLIIRPVSVYQPANTTSSNSLLTVWAPSGAVYDTNDQQMTNEPPPQPFIIEMDEATEAPILFTNVSQAMMKYIWQNDNPNIYTPSAVLALARLLSSFLAGTLQKDTAKADAMRKIYEEVELPHAVALDALMQRNRAYRDKWPSAFVRARR